MNYSSKELWYHFKKSLKDELNDLKSSNPEQLQRLKKKGERKYLLNEIVLPSVAQRMNLLHKSEFLRIDYAFCKKGKTGWNVPLVFIESENIWDACYEEALKLCSTITPLKVLIAYGFNEEIKKQIENFDNNEHYVFTDFKDVNTLFGWYVILLYENINDSIRFHHYIYDENGNMLDSEKGSFDI